MGCVTLTPLRGNTEVALAWNQKFHNMVAERATIEKELSEKAKIYLPTLKLEINVRSVADVGHIDAAVRKFDPIIIETRPLNLEEIDQARQDLGCRVSSRAYSEARRRSTVYYYLDGFIYHSGGGTHMLKSPELKKPGFNNESIPCSPAEWASIKAGNIPTGFFYSAR